MSSIPGAIIIEGHVQGLSNARALGKNHIPVWVVDKTRGIASYSTYCQKYFKCPDFKQDEFALFLIELAQKEGIKDWLLLPSNDHAVYTIAKHKESLSKYYKFVVSDLDIIENIYDKSKLLKVALQANVPVPATHYFERAEEKLPSTIDFPVLTKGRTGLTFYKALKKKAFLANNQDELKEQLLHVNKFFPLNQTFTQELIPFNGKNKTLSFTAFCIDGNIKTHWTGIKLREHPVQFGTATMAKSCWVPELLLQSELLLKELNYSGVCEIEYLQDPRENTFKLIEINARTWLWVGLAEKCGVNYAKIIYDYVNNNHPVYPSSYEKDVLWYNPITDFIYSLIGIFKRKVSVRAYLKTIFTKKTNALFVKGDRKPGFMYIINLVNFYKKR